ncbi:hypothetical protein H4V97_000269 [Flavobacterium sp. CG_23.5]|uniref:hypothetical protein n=1 Tax=Flavobacterium sp. CG_23.5 TaxID=2760708 RepID=UPI001AE5139B|nr:hypothetical protein [Flavobacterium sp. CG_23.5]MBP2281951.1 hypothetical protein [Flavobacterium sp. CG_23.5]
MKKEGINLFTFLKETKFTFDDYQIGYNYELKLFLDDYVDNTELFFIRMQKSIIDGQLKSFSQYVSELKDDEGNYDEILDLFQATIATTDKILEFFENRKLTIEASSKPQQNEPLEPEQLESFHFENNFDNIDETVILKFFKEKLVKPRYLKNEILESYLTFAFYKKEIPEVRFNIDNLNTKDKIIKIFYEYYKVVAGKPRGKQIDYAKLLGDYFAGFDTKTVSSNFSK